MRHGVLSCELSAGRGSRGAGRSKLSRLGLRLEAPGMRPSLRSCVRPLNLSRGKARQLLERCAQQNPTCSNLNTLNHPTVVIFSSTYNQCPSTRKQSAIPGPVSLNMVSCSLQQRHITYIGAVVATPLTTRPRSPCKDILLNLIPDSPAQKLDHGSDRNRMNLMFLCCGPLRLLRAQELSEPACPTSTWNSTPSCANSDHNGNGNGNDNSNRRQQQKQ